MSKKKVSVPYTLYGQITVEVEDTENIEEQVEDKFVSGEISDKELIDNLERTMGTIDNVDIGEIEEID